MTVATIDALDEAMIAPADPAKEKTYFGQVILVDAYACILQKGAGKVLFDPQQHTQDQKRIAIKISVECQSKAGSAYTVDQDVINTAKEWREITLPSLNAIKRDLRSLQGAFVQVKRTPTGEHYVNKSGERKDRTALQFVAVYASADEMQAAADVFYTPRHERIANGEDTFAPSPAPAAPQQPAVAPADDAARAQAATFLPMLWQMAAGDPTKFYNDLAANPVLSQYFSYESPEVQALTGGVPF